jgi:uncharacterized cupin superfamily protein
MEKAVSKFPRTYDSTGVNLILEGEVVITSDAGEVLKIEKGDLVTLEKELSCTWNIIESIKKHFIFLDE